MEVSKIKNLMICILVFVNLFLAGLLTADRMETERTRQTVNESIQDILSSRGIVMAENVLPDNSSVSGYMVSRDFDREREMVTAVLGRVRVEDMGGNILFYAGENGQAKFWGTGYFEILFQKLIFPVEQDNVATAQSILEQMGMEGTFDRNESVKTGNYYTTVVMNVAYQGCKVINCKVEFTFAADFPLLVEGTRILDEQQVDNAVNVLDAPTLLTRFLDVMDHSGYVCSEIRDIRPALQLVFDDTGRRLVPVWEIETNTKTFYLNVSTGEEQQS